MRKMREEENERRGSAVKRRLSEKESERKMREEGNES